MTILLIASAALASDPAPAPAPAAPAPAAPAPAATCTPVGSWTGTLSGGPQAGKTVTLALDASGKLTSTTPAGNRTAHAAFANGVLTVDKAENTGAGSCAPDQVGHYQLTFTSDCSSFTSKAVDEQCAGRKEGMDGTTFKKQ